jgi:hypothetical protein
MKKADLRASQGTAVIPRLVGSPKPGRWSDRSREARALVEDAEAGLLVNTSLPGRLIHPSRHP